MNIMTKIISLVSSNLESMEIIDEKTINIKWLDGRIYQYVDVDDFIIDELPKAQNAGNYFWNNIRGKYRFRNLNPRI